MSKLSCFWMFHSWIGKQPPLRDVNLCSRWMSIDIIFEPKARSQSGRYLISQLQKLNVVHRNRRAWDCFFNFRDIIYTPFLYFYPVDLSSYGCRGNSDHKKDNRKLDYYFSHGCLLVLSDKNGEFVIMGASRSLRSVVDANLVPKKRTAARRWLVRQGLLSISGL